MSQEPTSGPGIPPSEDTPTPPEKRKRRRWPWVLLALVLLLLALVALIPTIASTSLVRNIVVGKINQQLNGTLEIADWSLGWSGPVQASGIKVYDEQKRLILDIPRAKISLSLIDAVRQNFALGDDSVIDIASFVVNVDESGKTNLEKLPRAPGTSKAPTTGATILPNISGKVTLNFQGTIEGAGVKSPVTVDPSTAIVRITDINKPIESDVKLSYRIGGSEPSVIQTSGTIDAIRNNVLDIQQLAAGQKVALTSVNLAAFEPFLKSLGADTKLAGILTGGIDVKTQSLTGISAAGQIAITGVNFGGGPLGADTFAADRITIPVNIIRTGEGATAQIQFENVAVQMPGATVTVTGKVAESALLNLAQQKPPGAEGTISIGADISDPARCVNQLRNTLKLDKDVQLTSGEIRQRIDVALKPDRVMVSQSLDATAQGKRGQQTITLQPIHVAAGASLIPNGKSIPAVQDLKLDIKSAFATVQGGGASLAGIEFSGQFDLDKLRAEAAQFVDLGAIQLAGRGDFSLSTAGDVTDPSSPVNLKFISNLQNVKISGVANQQIDQDRLAVYAGGSLRRAEGVPQLLEGGYLSLVAGDPNQPLLDVDITANVDLAKQLVPWFELKKCAISSLPAVQKQYGSLIPALAEQKIEITSGALYAGAAGMFDGKTLTLMKPAALSIPTLTVIRAGQPLLNREIIRSAMTGSISLNNGIAFNLTDLDITTQSNLIKLSKTEGKPLTLNMSGQVIQGSGAVAIAADLKRLSDLAQAFTGPTSPQQPKLASGQLAGTLSLDRAIDFGGQISGLTVLLNNTRLIDNEQLAMSLSAKTPQDLASVGNSPIEAAGSIKSGFVNATIAYLRFSPEGQPMEMLQSANVEAQITDIPKLMAVVNAFSPVLGDIQITSGGATARVSVARDIASRSTTVDVPDLRVSRLRLQRLDKTFEFDRNVPISLKLNAMVHGTDRIAAITVNELAGDLRVATVSMPQKLQLTELQSERPVVNGAIKVDGKLEDVTPLLAVLQGGEPMGYAGTYRIEQKLATSPSKTSLTGAIDISNFAVLDGTRRPAFTEPRVAIRNDIDVDFNRKVLAIQELKIEMPQSQALAVSFAQGGGINYWADRREIRQNTKVDLTYDLAKLWTILYPMLSPEQQETYKDLKVAGKYTKTLTLSGAAPASSVPGESFKTLNADGSFSVDLLDAMGLNIQKLEPKVTMRRGIAQITAPPAVANEGTLDLSDVTVDITQANPMLSVKPKKRILRDVKLNPVLASSLGKFASLMFSNANEASGLLDVTVVECDRVPLGELLTKGSNARAVIAFSVRDLHLDGPVPKILGNALSLGGGGLNGGVPDSYVTLENGQTTSDVTLNLVRAARDERGRPVDRNLPLRFTGGMGLEKLDLRNFQVAIPKELIPTKLVGGDLRKFLPDPVVAPFTGTANNPQFDLGKVLFRNIPGGNLLGGQSGDGQSPLGGLLDQISPKRDDRPRDERSREGREQRTPDR